MDRIVLLVGILFSAMLAEAASPPSSQLTVALELQAGTTLPGIPVAFRVTFTNGGGASIPVPAKAALLVRDDQGESFLAASDVTKTILVVEEWAGQKIPPHQNASYTLNTRGLMNRPAWFATSRLSQPGRFEFQIMVGDSLREEMGIDEARQRAAVSNTVTLTVQEPSGADAEVWRLMRALGGGTWGPSLLYTESGKGLAKRIVAEYPTSSYTPWFASMGGAPTEQEDEAVLREWLSRAPEDSNTNWRRFRLAQWQIALANKYLDTQSERSHSYETNARAILNALLKVSGDDELTKHAKERLDYLDDPPIEW
ncbi:MAG TPA: hypothetical protein VNN08_12170 [Thermoanaerobaculia bacterium]|nr:hypothetical protein [Thermoanaerobaculia bacterium]